MINGLRGLAGIGRHFEEEEIKADCAFAFHDASQTDVTLSFNLNLVLSMDLLFM